MDLSRRWRGRALIGAAAIAALAIWTTLGSMTPAGASGAGSLSAWIIHDPIPNGVVTPVPNTGVEAKDLSILDAYVSKQFALRAPYTAAVSEWHEPTSTQNFTYLELVHYSFPPKTTATESSLFARVASQDTSESFCRDETGALSTFPVMLPTVTDAYATTCAAIDGKTLVLVVFPDENVLGLFVTDVFNQTKSIALAEDQYLALPFGHSGDAWKWIWRIGAIVLLLAAAIGIELRMRREVPDKQPAPTGRFRWIRALRKRPTVAFAASKLCWAAAVMFVVTFGTTMIAGLLPGTVATNVYGYLGPQAEFWDFKNGYDNSLIVQYWHWLYQALHGNLGRSLHSINFDITVNGLISNRAPITLEIAVLTLILSVGIALPFAMISASSPGGTIDKMVTAITAIAASLPVYISGVFLVELFALQLKWFPSQGWVGLTTNFASNIRHAVLPVATLAFTVFPVLLRLLRADLVSVANQDFVTAARSRGLPERYVMTHHLLRPAAASFVTYMGIAIGTVVSGSFLVEFLYTVPGLGYTVWNAVGNKDIPVFQGVVVITALTFIVINTFIDIAYRRLDPRVRVT